MNDKKVMWLAKRGRLAGTPQIKGNAEKSLNGFVQAFGNFINWLKRGPTGHRFRLKRLTISEPVR